jgi:Fe-S-cluster containining protein
MYEIVSLTLWGVGLFILLINTPFFVKRISLNRRSSQFKCMMCGNCCRFRVVPIDKEDVRRLEEAGYKDFYVKKGELMMKRVNGKCVFLKEDKCTVHKFRPRVCREFPFFKIYGIGYANKATFCPALEELENG